MVCACCKKNLRYRRRLNPYFTCHNRYSNEELSDLNETVQQMEASYIKRECDREALSVGNEFAVLSKEMIDHYIEKIIVYDEQNVEICWKKSVRVA